MRTNQKAYVSPELETKGDAVFNTRFLVTGDIEPLGSQPQDPMGEVGYGL